MQLRKTPTLEELLQESEVSTRSSNCHKASDGSVSHSSYFTGTADNILFPPLPEWKEKDGASLPPLTSTTYSAFFASNVTPQQKYQEGCLNNQHTSQQGSPLNSQNGVSHQSASSGYVTYENVENTPSVSGRIESGRASLGFSSSEGACNAGGFFLHSTSNTIAKMPDIISHPPIDGEELEKSGVESSLCQDLLVGKDLSCSSLQLDSIMCDHSPAERCESSHVDGTEPKDCLPVTAEVDLKEGHGLDRNSDFSGSPEFSHPSAHHCPATEPHIQHEPTDPESADSHVDEAEPSVEPYRLSLQALLKKSQEYRRRQRMLRNQAKNTKIQERTQEQARQSADERSLSDKENEELPQKGTVTAEGTKPREGRDVFILSGEPKKSWESQRMVESRCFGEKTNLKSGSTHLIGDGNMKEKTVAQEETAFKNNKLNISLDVITEPKQISALPPQQLVLTETSSAQGALDSTACPTSFHRGAGKYHTIPAPSFCRSPIHCKSSIQDGEAAERAEASKRKILVGAKLDKHPKVEGGKSEQPDGLGAGPSDVGRAETKVSAASSQHIDQLESNLSGLKALISDLEATLTENLSSHSQAGGDVPREFSFEQKNEREHARLRRSDEDYLQGKLGGGADDSEGNTRSPGTQSSRDLGNVHEDTGLEQSVSDLDSLPLPVEVPGAETVNLNQLRLVKTLATERAKEKGAFKEGLTKSQGRGGCRMQQPPAKCILSAAQQLRIPEVFRKAPSETAAPCDLSVLSDASNHPAERRNGKAAEGHDCSRLPSLNQSYDVDAPSNLWYLEGSGSDLGLTSCPGQEKHRTPESGDGGQGGDSKVKRRLIMHTVAETRDGRADGSRGAGPAVRPNSSTPKGKTCLNRSQRAHTLHGTVPNQMARPSAPLVLDFFLARCFSFMCSHVVVFTSSSCSEGAGRPGRWRQAGRTETVPRCPGQSPARGAQETTGRTNAGEPIRMQKKTVAVFGLI